MFQKFSLSHSLYSALPSSFPGKDSDTSELKPIEADLSKGRPTLKAPERFKDYVLGKTAGT